MTAFDGYRSMEWRDFAFSRLSLFGLFGQQKIVLNRRPVNRSFALISGQPRYLEVAFITDAQTTAHCVVDVAIRYFSLGREIMGESVAHKLFADPVSSAGPQRIWLFPPKRAWFAQVSFSRSRRGLQVALDGHLQLQKTQLLPGVEQFKQVMASRDLTAMSVVMSALAQAGDRERAKELLARMIYLGHDAVHERMLESLQDADRILAYGPSLNWPIRKTNGTGLFHYAESGLEYGLEVLPLAKALKAEARKLLQAIEREQAATIEIPRGEMWLGRLMVADMVKSVVPDVSLSFDQPTFAKEPQACGPWLRFEQGSSFLAMAGGKAIHFLSKDI